MTKAGGLTEKTLCCLVAAIILCFAIVGCRYFPESTFQLADDSRLPRWFHLPPGLSRRDVSVTMNYYTKPGGSDATFVLYDQKQHVLAKVNGKVRDAAPLHLKSSSQGDPTGYPLFEVVIANGVTEIMEHKKMEPTVYIVDDPAIWRELVGTQPLH
ncbi:MAG TPA: hypothetical protein VGF88_22210 [Acidobacteriaceae bacterium]